MSIPAGRSEASASQQWRYDVFLSFRSEDTRRSFTSHLYLTLRDRGVKVFIDDNRLRRSDDISPEIIQAIRSSRFSIIVFSRNYADSKLCLQELSEIIDCRKTLSHTVLPVFYNVDPSHVRKQSGSFGDAFSSHEEQMVSDEGRATIARWRAALTATGNLSGWDLSNLAKGSEAMIIREIARQIWVELKHTYLDIPKFLVGLDSRLNDMNLLLNDGSDAVCFIAICGMGGIGKTTLAKQVYNQFFHSFEAKSFLGNVRENSERPNDLVRMQEQLLSDILKAEKIKLRNVNMGVTMIRHRIRSRRVLIMLDDVNHADQLKSLARDRSWFGPGSRIVITTRNVDLLKEIEVDHVYMLQKLNGIESLQLFNWHAFKNQPHIEEFSELSQQITSYCQGLPLALQVLGSFLRDRTVVEWRSALEKLKRSPNGDIQKQLEISFDGLEDDNEKEIFLHIACFFVGWGKEHAVKILKGCGYSAEIGLSILSERFLVEFYGHNTLVMHDLLRDMGREIVRKESPKNPGKRSRLWLHTDILSTLRNKLGTNTVEGLMLNPPERQEVSTESFTGMSQLKLLQLNNVDVSIGKHGLLSQEIRWVSWHYFPLKFIPKEFYMGNMVSVDMQYSKLEAWQSFEILKNLTVLNLSHSHSLTKTPNFLQVPNLEELLLENCIELKEVHESIGHLRGLVLLNLQNCKKLKNLPDSICAVKSLQVLDISGCFYIKKLPDNFGEMESLVKLIAHGTSVEHVPPSISRLKSLTELSLYGLKTSSSASPVASLWSRIVARESPNRSSQLISSLEGLTLLKSLSLMGCSLQDGSIPATFKNLQFLEDLYLGENDFRYLPDSMSQLSNLSYFRMDDCPNLVSLPAMPPSLCYLNTSNCLSLESISLEEVECAILSSPNCPKLTEVSGLSNWTMDGSVQFVGCNNLSTKFQDFLLKEWQCGKYAEFVMPRSDIPSWFDYQTENPSLSFKLPSCQSCKLKGVTVCVVGAFHKKSNFFADKNTQIIFRPGITVTSKIRTFRFSIIAHEEYEKAALRQDHMIGFHLSHKELLDGKDCVVEVSVNPGRDWVVKRVGVYFRREYCEYCSVSQGMILDITGFGAQQAFGAEVDHQAKRMRTDQGLVGSILGLTGH